MTIYTSQRIGINDENLNWSNVLLRPESWFLVLVFLSIFSIKSLRINDWPDKNILIKLPLIFLIMTLLASLLSGIFYDVYYNKVGVMELVLVIISINLGIYVYIYTINSKVFSKTLMRIFLFAPALNFLAIIAINQGINNISGFNDNVGLGEGFIGFGGRFQGFSSNANTTAFLTIIAISLLTPEIFNKNNSWLKRTFFVAYCLALFIVLIWTGSRGGLLSIIIIIMLSIWFSFSMTINGIINILVTILTCFFAFTIVMYGSDHFDIFHVLLERLDHEDGRLFLWKYYFEIFLSNPLGLGIGYETIADSTGINGIDRLPPHNFLLHSAMLAGLPGLIVTLLFIYLIFSKVQSLKIIIAPQKVPPTLLSLYFAWITILFNMIFGGFIFGNFIFSIINAMLLAECFRISKKI